MFFLVFYIYPCCFQVKPWNSWQNDNNRKYCYFPAPFVAIMSVLILKRHHVDELLGMLKESTGSLKDFKDAGLASRKLPVGCDTALGA